MSCVYDTDGNNNDDKHKCSLTQLGSLCCTTSPNNNQLKNKSTDLNHIDFPDYSCCISAKLKDNQTDYNGLNEFDDHSSIENSDDKENQPHRNVNKKAITIKLKSTKELRGILKYPPGWRRRAISESSAYISQSSFSDDTGYFGTSLESPEILFDLEEDDVYNDGDCADFDKPKKNVTFSDKMATFVFRRNSSILGRRLKNQKKAKKKRDKKERDSISDYDDESSVNGDSSDACDSVTDASSSSGCDSSASECSADEANVKESNDYKEECDTSKSNRKSRRKRNRKNKQNVRTHLEIGGYDSD